MRLVLLLAMLAATVSLALGVGASVATASGGADGCTGNSVLTQIDPSNPQPGDEVDSVANGGNGNGFVCVDVDSKKVTTVVDDNPPKEKKKHV